MIERGDTQIARLAVLSPNWLLHLADIAVFKFDKELYRINLFILFLFFVLLYRDSDRLLLDLFFLTCGWPILLCFIDSFHLVGTSCHLLLFLLFGHLIVSDIVQCVSILIWVEEGDLAHFADSIFIVRL